MKLGGSRLWVDHFSKGGRVSDADGAGIASLRDRVSIESDLQLGLDLHIGFGSWCLASSTPSSRIRGLFCLSSFSLESMADADTSNNQDDAVIRNSVDDDVEVNESDNESVGQASPGGSSDMPSSRYSQQKMRPVLAEYIASSGQVFTSAQHVRFEKFIQEHVQPEYIGVPLHIITNDSLRLFRFMKEALIFYLSRFDGTVSFSTNFWSGANDKLGYVCVTAHYIDSDWMLQRRILTFDMLKYPHSDDVIFQSIMDIFREYKIDDKVFNITFDDVTGSDAIIDMFKNTLQPTRGGQFSYMRCLTRMVNSMVQEGLKLMQAHIEKIRAAVLYIVSSYARQAEFAALCESRGLKYKVLGLKHDFKDHWDSTFLMLESCVNYSAAISEFYNGKHDGGNLLSESDWEISFVFMKILEVFHSVAPSNYLYYSPSGAQGLMFLNYVRKCFDQHRGHSIPEFTATYDIMESKFKSYCASMLPSFCVAAAMDPRWRGCLDSIANVMYVYLSMPLLNISANFTEARLHDLYRGYESKFAENEDSTSDPMPKRKRYDDSDDTKTDGLTELHRYLAVHHTPSLTSEEFMRFDSLAWWKEKSSSFPVLSKMASDLLTPTAFAIAPEFLFSTTGNQVLDYKRSTQPDEMLECLFCMKDWADARLRAQKWTDDDLIEVVYWPFQHEGSSQASSSELDGLSDI